MPKTSKATVRIIACGVFRPALEYLQIEAKYPQVRLTYLPSNLHLQPSDLKIRLLKEFRTAREKGEKVICLYGECFPGLDDVCRETGVAKISGHHCHQMLLGAEQFNDCIDETAGTYFLEKDLIVNFEEYCMGPLELDDDEMRRLYFEHYQRLLYVRQPSDPDLAPETGQVADFLGLPCVIRDADYRELEEKLSEAILSVGPE